jgi:hypothetical protein
MQVPYDPKNPPMPNSKTGFGAIEMNSKRQYWDSQIKFMKLEPQGWQRFRFIGPVTKVEYHWLELPRKNNGAVKRIPLICPDFDVKLQQKNFSNPQCPICRIGRDELKQHERFKKILPSALYLTYIIVRSNQENPMNGAALNPIKLSSSLARKLYELSELNQVNYQGQVLKADLADPYWGRDVFINYDSTKAPADRYMVNLDQAPRPLTGDEFAYLNTLVDFRSVVEMSTPAEIENALISCNYVDRTGNLILTPPSTQPGYQINTVAGINSDLANHVVSQGGGLQFQTGSVSNSGASQSMPANYFQTPTAPVTQQATTAPKAPAMPPPPQAPVFIDSAPGAVTSFASQAQTMSADTSVSAVVSMGASGAVEHAAANFMHQTQTTGQTVLQQGNAALQAQPQNQPYAVPSFEKKFQVVGTPKALTGAELEQFIKQYAEANAALCTPLQPATDGELLGFHVPKCYAKYRGDSVCIRCPVRKQCIA